MSRFRNWILSFLFCASLSCADRSQSAFDPPRERVPIRFSSEPIIEELKGILLIPNQDYVDYCDTRYVRGLEAYDLCVPDGVGCLAEVLEPLFMNCPVSKELLTRVKEEIVLYYRNHNHPVVSVYIPEQTVQNGVLKMVVMEACVGTVAASGNCWFSSWLYESFIRLRPGDAITADTLLTDVSWINRNPFRNVDVVFTPGCDQGTTNIELVACDRCPVQVYVGADNTGTTATGIDRIYAGATWGNAFWLDHIATYQYTTSYNFREFQSHTFHYTAPLFWRHLLLLFGGYSSVDPDSREFQGSDGSFFQSSIRYVMPFGCNYNATIQEWSLGFDWKYYDNNLFFTSDEVFTIIRRPVNLSQFVIGYAYGFEDECQRFSFNFDLYGSPGKLLPHESNERYRELSPQSQVRYIYGKMTIGETLYFPYDFSGSILGRVQIASHNLLPSERFGLGGYNTVRGYFERILNVDDALVLNLELRTPPVSLINLFGGDSCYCDDLLFLVFYDYAIGGLTNRHLEPGFVFTDDGFGKTEYLMSFGPGMRYTIDRYLALRVDWGIKLHGANKFSDKARSRWHAGIVLSY